jgi:hypothetical protein
MAQNSQQQSARRATRGARKKERARQQRAPQRQQEPTFPFVMMVIAIVKDFAIDPIVLLLSLPPITLLGWAIGALAGALMYLTVWLWFLFRDGSLYERRMQVYLLIAFLTSVVPIVRFIVPEYTLIIWLQYRSERKHAQQQA